MIESPLQRGQPAPPFPDLDVGVVEGRCIDLEVALGTALHIDESAIGLGKAGGRQHQIGLLDCLGILMIDHQQVLQAGDGRIDPIARGAAIEIVLQGHQRQVILGFDALEGSFQRFA